MSNWISFIWILISTEMIGSSVNFCLQCWNRDISYFFIIPRHSILYSPSVCYYSKNTKFLNTLKFIIKSSLGIRYRINNNEFPNNRTLEFRPNEEINLITHVSLKRQAHVKDTLWYLIWRDPLNISNRVKELPTNRLLISDHRNMNGRFRNYGIIIRIIYVVSLLLIWRCDFNEHEINCVLLSSSQDSSGRFFYISISLDMCIKDSFGNFIQILSKRW